MQVQPYIFFEGRCEEALEYYRKTLGAEVQMLMRYQDSPEPPQGKAPPGDKVMHAAFRIGDTVLMGSDGYASGKPSFQGFSLALTVASDAEAERKFNALADGGRVLQPLIKTFFSSRFGMLTDRFGMGWMVTVAESAPKK